MVKLILYFSLCFLLLTTSVFAENKAENSFELVILNGRVIDPETKLDAILNIGINHGKIVSMTKKAIKGKQIIDAKGLVVAPGFIDTHWHGISKFGTKLALLNGVTTWLESETGVLDVDLFYKERQGWHANYGTTVGHIFARSLILDGVTGQDGITAPAANKEAGKDGVYAWSTVIPNEKQNQEIFALMDKGLKQGAIGIGSLVGYASTGVTAQEMYEVQKLAGSYGRLTAVHTRFSVTGKPPTEFVLGGHEIIANAITLNAPVIFQHFNNDNWQLAAKMLADARQQGHNIWGEVYPYRAFSTLANADFLAIDELAKAGLTPEKNVLDPATGEFMSTAAFAKMRAENPSHSVVIFSRPEEWIPQWVALKGVTIGSDAMLAIDSKSKLLPENAPFEQLAAHPRTAGAQAKTLRIAREHNIPLMDVIANLSYWSAKYLGDTGLKAMKNRGRLQEGMVADITIFNAKTVQDHATYQSGKNGLPPTGIPYVIVNGVLTINEGKLVPSAHAGQAIRFPVITAK